MRYEKGDCRVCTQLRISETLWQEVRHAAVDECLSANAMVILLISEALEARRARLRNAQSLDV